MIDRSKYRMIADLYREKIYNGTLLPGTKFYTRTELSEKYCISPMTSFRVQKDLSDEGLISMRPGVGFFVNSPNEYLSHHYLAPLRKIRMIGSPQAIGASTRCGPPIQRGAESVCQAHHLKLNLEFIQVLNNPNHIINTSRTLAPDEALLVFLHGELLPEIVNLLVNPHIRAVTIGRTFPDRTAVLPDHHHAIAEIFDYCNRFGVRRLLYTGFLNAGMHLWSESDIYENIQNQAHDFLVETDFSGHHAQLVQHIRSFKPDAIVFSDDESVYHLLEIQPDLRQTVPLFFRIGCVQREKLSHPFFPTYYYDMEAMGRCATELLISMDQQVRVPLHRRIKGYLKIPDQV